MAGTHVQHHLAPRTRSLLVATAGTAVVAAADLLDRGAETAWAVAAAFALVAAAGLLVRARHVAMGVDADQLVVHNLFRTHVVPVSQVTTVTPNQFHTVVELRDGRRITSLLRDVDLDGFEDELRASTGA